LGKSSIPKKNASDIQISYYKEKNSALHQNSAGNLDNGDGSKGKSLSERYL
jgi:hypothetical protein